MGPDFQFDDEMSDSTASDPDDVPDPDLQYVEYDEEDAEPPALVSRHPDNDLEDDGMSKDSALQPRPVKNGEKQWQPGIRVDTVSDDDSITSIRIPSQRRQPINTLR